MNRSINQYNRAEEIIGFPECYDLLFAFIKGTDLRKVTKALKAAGYSYEIYSTLHKKAEALLDAAELRMDEELDEES